MKKYSLLKDRKFGYFKIFPTPSKKEVNDYYEKEFYSSKSKYFNNSSLKVQLQDKDFFNSRWDNLHNNFRKFKKKKKILDIGCGWCQSLIYLKKKGYDCYGFDPSKEAVDYGVKNKINVKHAAIEEIRVFGNKKPPLGAVSSWVLFFGGWVGQQTGFSHLQAVVARKVHHKIPGHDVVIAQFAVHDHALDPGQCGGNAPRGIAQVTARRSAAGTELAHDARQAFGPVAGPERLAVLGDALDENFFGVVGNHRIEVCINRTRSAGSPPTGLPKYSILYKT